MSSEAVKQHKSSSHHFCQICGKPTETYVRDAVNQTKVPLCEGCFRRIQPTRKNKQRVEFWRLIFPIVEEAYA
ncbi:MAG: hypothetical protein OEW62_00825 [Candidatus Bathyarchaeota archaeon]|nr:hypothetical protein [Candidatus Bathyarchaeota archaeon]MDH5745435.1 hypothetical protein [Candidatus Bathyarchaeota archaeon]